MQVMWNQNCTDKVLYKCIEFKDIAIYWKHATTLSLKWKTPDFLQNLFVELVDKRWFPWRKILFLQVTLQNMPHSENCELCSTSTFQKESHLSNLRLKNCDKVMLSASFQKCEDNNSPYKRVYFTSQVAYYVRP